MKTATSIQRLICSTILLPQAEKFPDFPQMCGNSEKRLTMRNNYFPSRGCFQRKQFRFVEIEHFPALFFDDSDLYSSLTTLPHSRRRETLTQRHSVTSRGPEIWFLVNCGCLQQMRWQTSSVQAPNISPTLVSSLIDQLNTNSLSDSSNSVVWTGQRFQPTQ